MREIRFRGFNRKNGEWLHGFYLQNRGAHFVCPDEWANGKSWDDYEADPESVGQFTGLLDKNGQEVYEGDILYSEFGDGIGCEYLVDWNAQRSCFGLMDKYEYRSKLEGYDFPEFNNNLLVNLFIHSKLLKVVGNIYEHKTMLEKDEKL